MAFDLRISNILATQEARTAKRRAELDAQEQPSRDRERDRAPEPTWQELLTAGLDADKKDAQIALMTCIIDNFAKAAADPTVRPNVVAIPQIAGAYKDSFPENVRKMLLCAGICSGTVAVTMDRIDSDGNLKTNSWWYMCKIEHEFHDKWCCMHSTPNVCKARAAALARLGISGDILASGMAVFLKARASHFISVLDDQIAKNPSCEDFSVGDAAQFDDEKLLVWINNLLATHDIFFKAKLDWNGKIRCIAYSKK